MSKLDSLVERMATLIGISQDYTDAFGHTISTEAGTKRALLAALGLKIGSEDEAQESLIRLERLKCSIIPALIPITAGVSVKIKLRDPAPETAWSITDEYGGTHEGRIDEGDDGLVLPALPIGYHRLQLGDVTATLIAAPDRCWAPEALDKNAHWWGLSSQLYSLRSAHDLGIGDYSDVASLAEGVGATGGAFLGLSPVHALFSTDRRKISPYSPSSRLFLETLFIDPKVVPGFAESGAQDLLNEPEMQARLTRLQEAQLVDYPEVWSLKRPVLDLLWSHFQTSGDRSAFESFRISSGDALEVHATFEALSEYFHEQGLLWVGEWPGAFRSAASDEVRRFRHEHADRVSFHAWLQWIADQQLSMAANRAHASGLPIGLYRDLAVGADAGGSEIWSNPERYAHGVSVGAPPDPLGPQGQNWGLPPFNPLTLEEQGLAAFRDLVAANMRHAGAIRIDHAFQLQRLFLIPSGARASQGTYVSYPFDSMLASLRVESHRAKCLIIAEDLGTAPEGFSNAIMESGLFSYRVLPFERDGAAFKSPHEYPRSAISVISTHDLPTFKGWWSGLDIDLRQTFGIFDPERATAERSARLADKRHFAEALVSEKLLPSPESQEEPPLEGALRYLARTNCALTALQIEDASGELNQANMPGMDDGHPNWRRRLSSPVEALLAPGSSLTKMASILAEEGRDVLARKNLLASPPPRATYRLQLHENFTFCDAAKIVPYLAKLGISHVYLSPIQMASIGSTHGYDIVDHSIVNPELGGEEGFRRLSKALQEKGLKILLDIVPNHMGVGGQTNDWWLSVLEWGQLSPVAHAFDIDWERPGSSGKLIAPVLGSPYGEALERGELQLKFDEKQGSFSVWHWDHRFPISPKTYSTILEFALSALEDQAETKELHALSEDFRALAGDDYKDDGEILDNAERMKRHLAQIAASSPAVKKAVDGALGIINGNPNSPESFNILHRLLEEQPYRLTYWRVASSDINYRRFFDINTLAGIRVEVPEVFEETHDLIIRLVNENHVHGLRIDHVDGLADPEGYVRRLQGKVGPGFYVVVEKILEPGEKLRSWPVSGTTGYDVLNLIDGVFLDHRNAEVLERIYREASGLRESYEDLLKQAKLEITQTGFASELEVLVGDIKKIADADRRTRDYTAFSLRRALVEIIAEFPVYRSYLGEGDPDAEDIRLIEETIEQAKRFGSLADTTVHDFVAAALLGRIKAHPADLHRFRRRFQQLTGPVMAKSLEDTLFYRYGRLIALNEVGGDPGHFGLPPDAFHEANAERAQDWPHTMIATATHDTKRGEDARARLLALSELPDDWEQALMIWRQIITSHLTDIEGAPAPDANDQVILLQSLLGAWPLELLESPSQEQIADFQKRMEGYVTKALREAKRHTSWINPDEAYESAALKVVKAALTPESSFLRELRPFAHRLSQLGMLNGLSRTILKLTLPGIPDIYQGAEFWDLSLVDPDNRRPVDYTAREQAFSHEDEVETLIASWPDGRIKQRFIACLLKDRAEAPLLYAEGDYRALDTDGEHATHLLAYMRRRGAEELVVIVPRLWAGLVSEGNILPDKAIWDNTSIAFPKGRWRNVLTGDDVIVGDAGAKAGGLLSPLPFCVLRRSGGPNAQQQ